MQTLQCFSPHINSEHISLFFFLLQEDPSISEFTIIMNISYTSYYCGPAIKHAIVIRCLSILHKLFTLAKIENKFIN